MGRPALYPFLLGRGGREGGGQDSLLFIMLTCAVPMTHPTCIPAYVRTYIGPVRGYEAQVHTGSMFGGALSQQNNDPKPLFSPTGAAPDLGKEPWFVGMMDGVSVKGKMNKARVGQFVVRESQSTPWSYVIVAKEAAGVKEFKTKFEKGLYIFTSSANADKFQTMSALLESVPTATTPAKALCSNITRRASLRVQSEDSKRADEMLRNKVVNEVPEDYGIDKEPWYERHRSLSPPPRSHPLRVCVLTQGHIWGGGMYLSIWRTDQPKHSGPCKCIC